MSIRLENVQIKYHESPDLDSTGITMENLLSYLPLIRNLGSHISAFPKSIWVVKLLKLGFSLSLFSNIKIDKYY